MKILECLKFSESVFGTFNLLITVVFFFTYFLFQTQYRKFYIKHKNDKLGSFLRSLKTRKVFIAFWAFFIFLNFIPILCYVKHKIDILSKDKKELEEKYRDFQNLLVEASGIINMSQDYYEKIRKQLIYYPPNVRLSTSSYSRRRKKLMQKFIHEDLKNNYRCLTLIKELKQDTDLSPILIIERLKNINNGVCKNSYYTLYLTGLNAIKANNLLEAKNYLSKAIKIAENKGIYDCTLYHTYAQLLLLLEEYPEAKEFLRKTLAFCPYHPYADAQIRVLPELKKITLYKKKVEEFRKKLDSLKKEEASKKEPTSSLR